MKLYAIISLFLGICSFPSPNLALSVHTCQAKMPEETYYNGGFYDGGDTIYIFGGLRMGKKIMRYSISQDELYDTGSELPVSMDAYATFKAPDGDVLIYGNGDPEGYYWPSFGYVYKWNPITMTGEIVRQGASLIRGLGAAQISVDEAVLIGGLGKMGITHLNLSSMEFRNVIPSYPVMEDQLSSVVTAEGDVFSFSEGSQSQNRPLHITKYTPSSGEITLIDTSSVDVIYPETYFGRPISVLGGNGTIYILGGFGQTVDGYDAFIQYDPVTNTAVTHGVEYAEGKPYIALDTAEAIYVERLNRIYLFGGYQRSFPYSGREAILYIQLDN